MNEPIAVVSPYPALRRGLRATIGDAGFITETPDQLLEWAARHTEHPVVVIAVDGGNIAEGVRELRRQRADLTIVLLVPHPSTTVVRELLAAGACTVAGWDVAGNDLVGIVEGAIRDRSVLPVDQVRRLALGVDSAVGDTELTDRQLDWLRALGAGVTVCELAAQAGYSERAMYRLLADLYARLGVRTRVQALVWAAQRGIIV